MRFGRELEEQHTGYPIAKVDQSVELGLYFVKFAAVMPHLVARLAHESPDLTRI